MNKPTLRWRRNKRQSGLAGIVEGPLGYGLYLGEEQLASICYSKINEKFMWSCATKEEYGIYWKNSAAEGIYFSTPEAAKTAASAHIKSVLKR